MFALMSGITLIVGNTFNLLNGYPQSRHLARYRKVVRVLYGLGIGYGAALILTAIVPSWHPLSWYLLLLVASGAGSATFRMVSAWRADRLTGAVAWFLLTLLLLCMLLVAVDTVLNLFVRLCRAAL